MMDDGIYMYIPIYFYMMYLLDKYNNMYTYSTAMMKRHKRG